MAVRIEKVLFFAAASAVLTGCGGGGESSSPFAGRYVGTADITSQGDSSASDQTGASTTGTITRDGMVTFVSTYPRTYLQNTVPVTFTVTDTITAKVFRKTLNGVLEHNVATNGASAVRYDGKEAMLEESEGLLTVSVLFGDEPGATRYVFRLQKSTS